MQLLSGCAGDPAATPAAGAAGPVAKSADRAKPVKASGRRARTPKPDATTAWRSLAFFLPKHVEGFQPRAVMEGHDLDVGGEEPVLMAKRAYGNREGVSLELELLDAANCPRLRELVARTRELSRDTREAVLRPLKVQGLRAQAQWFASNKTARTSVLVGDRFIVHAVVKPADSPALSIAVAEQLDYAALQKLPPLAASTAALAAEPAPPPQSAAEPSPTEAENKSTSIAAASDDAIE